MQLVPYTIYIVVTVFFVSSRVRIVGAIFLGVIIIGGAFYLRNAREYEKALLGGIAVSDVSPRREVAAGNWEASLRTLTLARASTTAGRVLGTDVDYEADTVTERFAQSFFEQYLASDAVGALTPENQEAFLTDSLKTLAPEVTDTLFTSQDIRTTESSPEAVRAYGNILSEITTRHSGVSSENELAIFARAVAGGDTASQDFKTLTNIATAYKNVLTDTLNVSAPSEFRDEHLALVNAYLAIHNDIAAMADAQNDPLYALVRTKRYDADVQALYALFTDIYSQLYRAGVRYAADEPGALFQTTAP